jgi:MFS family permease
MGRIGDAVRETGASLGTVFGNPALRRLNLAFAGSAIGDWAYATAIVVWAYDAGGITAVGLWGTVRLLLMAVVTPFASAIVDKVSRKGVMITTDLVRASLVLGAAALIWTDAPDLTVYVIATLAAVAGTPFRPAVSALLPRLVTRPEELTAANGTFSTIESLAFFVGPAIGGILLGFAEVPVVIVLNAVTFLWSAAMVSAIRVPKTAAATDSDEGDDDGGDAEPARGFLSESMDGFRTIWGHRDLRLVSGVYCAQTVVAGASIAFGVAIAVEMTDFGSRGVGYLDSVFGVGALVGGLVAISRASRQRLASDFGVGVVFWALPLLLVAAVPQTLPAFASLFIIGAANPIVDVNASTILQRLTPDAVLGRVFGALETGLISAMALGSIAMPLLITGIGLRWSLVVMGVAITAVVLPAMGRLRRLDAELRDPEGFLMLRQIPLFAPLEPKSLERVAQQLIRIEVPAGETVIREGEAGDRFYVVETGRVSASFQGELLSTSGPGDPFGEIALLRDVPRTATVVADEPSVLLALERDDFLNAVTGNSEVSSRADDLIARRIPTY